MPEYPIGLRELTSYPYPFGGASVSILDTDFILDIVKDRAKGAPQNAIYIVRQFKIPGNRIFASAHVLEELYKPDNLGNRHKWDKMASQSKDEGWPTSAHVFQDIFEREYLCHISFVDVTGVFEGDPLVEKVRAIGASDAPTAQLVVLLGRTHPRVFGRDISLREPGIAPQQGELQNIVDAARDLDEANISIEAVSGSATLALVGADAVSTAVADFLGVSKWATRLIGIAGLTYFLVSPERRERVAQILAPAVELVAERMNAGISAVPRLASAVPPVQSIDSLQQRIAEILVVDRSSSGLLAREIRDALKLPDPEMHPSIPELRHLMNGMPCFTVNRWRYQVGSKIDQFFSEPSS